MELNDRINQVIKAVYGSQAAAARALNVDRQRINAIVNGMKPGLDFIVSLTDRIEKLNLNWLIYGKGPMFVSWDKIENQKGVKAESSDINIDRIINMWEDERKTNEILMKENLELTRVLNERLQFLEKTLYAVYESKIKSEKPETDVVDLLEKGIERIENEKVIERLRKINS
jgi:hypothetical protein